MRISTMLAAAAVSVSLFSAAAFAGPAAKTVEEVNKEKAELSGQQVKLEGDVVKVNNGIMRRNFVHIEDGSGSGDTAKVIITSKDTAKVGDHITVVGTVKLDTDFGMGYFYPLLIEDSSITVVK